MVCLLCRDLNKAKKSKEGTHLEPNLYISMNDGASDNIFYPLNDSRTLLQRVIWFITQGAGHFLKPKSLLLGL